MANVSPAHNNQTSVLVHTTMNPPTSPKENIALLIDSDNAPAAKIDFIIAELATYGVVNIRRAYGNTISQCHDCDHGLG
jgi:hypothetical protein